MKMTWIFRHLVELSQKASDSRKNVNDKATIPSQ